MKKKKLIAVITTLLLLCAMVFITTCEMEVDEAVRNVSLTDPYISLQPQSHSWYVGDTYEIPELSIDVKDWDTADGNISYQWYTFDDFEQYIKTGGDAISGETGKTYTPTSLKDAAGDRNYYYVKVTNNNPRINVGIKTKTVQSDVAILSFSATDEALAPIISSNPTNAQYMAGRAVNELSTRAVPRSWVIGKDDKDNDIFDTAEHKYQWYSIPVVFDESGNVTEVGARKIIPGQTDPLFGPDAVRQLGFGKNYFQVVVYSTENEKARQGVQEGIPAFIEIVRGVRAIAPNIEIQPRDRMFFTTENQSDITGSITVRGTSRDNGTITYQWYRNEGSALNESTASEVGGATSGVFTPPITPGQSTIQYYFAKITNTNEFVTSDQTTATVNSKVVKISIAASANLDGDSNAYVEVANPMVASNRYQYVRGFGGMDVAWTNFPAQDPIDMEIMYNPDKLGYNINRIMISPGKLDPVEGIQDLVNGSRPDYYENVKIVNKYGGYNLASPWSPPKEWKSNNSINGGGHLIYSYRKQFADYLKQFAQHMYDRGAPIYAISISNEPNYTAGYDGCEWTPLEMRDFFIEVGRFTEGIRGYGGGKQIPTVLTVNGESANNPNINVEALKHPLSRAAIDLLCRHVYGEQTTTLWRFTPQGDTGATPDNSTVNNILDRGDGTKMEVWMTEHNINSANALAYPSDSTWNYVWRFMNDVDLVIRLNNENAFVWWASKRFYSMIGDGQYATINHAVLPRGYGLSHYAKYANDTHRIATTVSGTTATGTPLTFETMTSNVNNRTFSLDNGSARITAFASINSGKDNAPISGGIDDVEFISLVMWTPTNTSGTGGYNLGKIKITMPDGFIIGSYTAIVSDGAGDANSHKEQGVTIHPDRNAAYVDLGPSKILSVKFVRK